MRVLSVHPTEQILSVLRRIALADPSPAPPRLPRTPFHSWPALPVGSGVVTRCHIAHCLLFPTRTASPCARGLSRQSHRRRRAASLLSRLRHHPALVAEERRSTECGPVTPRAKQAAARPPPRFEASPRALPSVRVEPCATAARQPPARGS
ncbi:hypothetical protein AB1Y20_006316 [Prymnesium parvum]|uniref:Uncharacterized protein n=1 Tax=Prymnesium parvum TaxID=97485 RepID=A0AB34IX19_PRYPA